MQAAGGYSGPSYFTTKLRVWGFDVSPRLTAPECISKTRLLVTLIPCVDLSQSAARCLASNNVAPSKVFSFMLFLTPPPRYSSHAACALLMGGYSTKERHLRLPFLRDDRA